METKKLGLALTGTDETQMTFKQWRTLINGTNSDSNMQKIDKAIEDLEQYADGLVADKTPFYQIEPDAISGLTISGTVYYKESNTGLIQKYNYSFNYADFGVGTYCISANQNSVDSEVVTLELETSVTNRVILAYVDINTEDGIFDNFHVVGDKYIDYKFEGIDQRFKNEEIITQNYINEHNTSENAHSDIREKIDDIRENPSYRFTATGGTVQRFDNVNAAEHNIDVVVHGKVTNPTVSVYGKNLFKTIPKSDGKGYETIGSIIKITNPTAAAFSNTVTYYHDSIILGKGTYTLSVEAVGEAELASGAHFQIIYKLGDSLLSIGITNLNKKYSKVLNVDSPTTFSFNQVNMGKVPTSADLSVQIQLEVGDTATDFVEAVEPQTVTLSTSMPEGVFTTIKTFKSVSPTMTIIENNENNENNQVDVTYNRNAVKHSDIDESISAHNADNNAHGALFGSINSALSGISGGLEAAVEKGNTTADTVALLQKYPCYEHAASGGAVQRFDDVSVIPHNICVTVHGATDESGNSVTNPTVKVYGANLMPKTYVDTTLTSNFGDWSSGRMPGYINLPVIYGQKLRLIVDGKAVQCRYKITDKNGVTLKALTNTYSTNGHIIDVDVSNAAYLTFRMYTDYTEDGATHEVMLIGGEGNIPDYMEYIEPQTVTVPMTFAEGEIVNLTTFNAVSPTMTVIASDDNELVSVVGVTYNRLVQDEIIERQNETSAEIDAKISAHNSDSNAHADIRSELTDIRTGVDGTVYDSAGNAVRTQLSGKIDINGVGQVTKENTTFYQQYQTRNVLNVPDGDYYAPSNRIKYNVTDNIFTATRMTEVVYNCNTDIGGTFTPTENGNYTLKEYGISANPNNASVHVMLYDDSGNKIIDGYIGGAAKTATLTAGTTYHYLINVNSSYFNALLPNVGDSLTFKVQLEKGDTDSDWINPIINEIPEIKSLDDDISTAKSDIAQLKEYPDYVSTEIERVKAELIEKMALGNVAVIGFNTDQHASSSIKNAVGYGLKAMRDLSKSIPFNLICLGGDSVAYNAEGDEVSEIISNILFVNEAVSGASCNVVSIAGNHDSQNNSEITNNILFNAHFKRYVAQGKLTAKDNISTNGYIDDDSVKIRYIICDTTSRTDYDKLTACREWLTTSLSTLPTGYSAVIFSHHALTNEFNGEFTSTTGLWQGMGCQDILATYKDNIICCISGHWHKSASVTDSNGINYIVVTSAMYTTNEGTLPEVATYPRTSGTATETAFDIFVIDQVNKKIYALRYGAGGADANREWNYQST